MKKVYLETTIPSYMASRPSRDIIVLSHQEITNEWWANNRHNYKLFISQVVIDEIGGGDKELIQKRYTLIKNIPLLEYNNDVEILALKYFEHFKFPKRALRDAFHIAFAVNYNIDFLLTWNCSHLANANIRANLVKFNYKLGYNTPDICTPEELIKIPMEE